MHRPKQKLYCYVDETGQDTGGRFFLVAIIITGPERDSLIRELEQIENESLKGTFKWKKTSIIKRSAYFEGILASKLFVDKISYTVFLSQSNYQELTIQATAQAIVSYPPDDAYQATVYIDGLSKTGRFVVGAGLRSHKIKVKRVRGITDESNALIRLADAIAGLLRDYLEGDSYAKPLYEQATITGLLKKL